MKENSDEKTEIPIETDADAKRILQDDIHTLSRELLKAAPGVDIAFVGVPGSSKDAGVIITATAGLVVALTPIITQVISGFFATRGIKVELKADAKNGNITYKASKG
jgi:hypothetical protein